MKVNILFPVLNEERRLEKGILKTLIYLTRNKIFDYQLTIVDNGSMDETEAISQRLCEKYSQVQYIKTCEKGVGLALRTGIEQNTCDIVGYMDIDLSTKLFHLKDVKEIFDDRPDIEIIKGSRLLKGSQVIGRKTTREFTSQGLNIILQGVFKNHFTDGFCGFDFFRKETVEKLISISSQDNGWFYCVELLLRAERLGIEVKDIPVVWEDDYDTKVNVVKTTADYLKKIYQLKSQFIKEDQSQTQQKQASDLKIPANNLLWQYKKHQTEYEKKAIEVLRSGSYVLGKEVETFERDFAKTIGTEYCVGLGNCLDALWLSFRILGIGSGDEVIVPGNTYIASVMGVTINGATPVFVEPDEFHNLDASKIEEKITDKTKAILVVHLYGQSCEMDKILEICSKHQLYLVEDCAQSHGGTFKGQTTGSFGDIGCFSFYPSKNLGAFGDGGAITTNNEKLAKEFKIYRYYGSEKRYYNKVVGTNSRLDEIQAGLLNVKLKHLEELNADRCRVCNAYLEGIKNPMIALPKIREEVQTVWHQFVIETHYRDEFKDYLEENGIGSIIHYPIPPHLSEAYAYLKIEKGAYPITETLADCVLSLPLYYGMTENEIEKVIQVINDFCPKELKK
jgi:dTDP-4-amino-4,6-dideoxygalactose transaminase